MPQRPLVGISTYHRDGDRRPRFHLPTAYVDAVRLGGGASVLLPPGDPHPARLIERLDGLVLAGGGDLHPEVAGGALNAASYSMSRERDDFELALVHEALAAELPVLAICRGTQVLNVALGGDLVGHLPDAVGEDVPHRKSQDESIRHGVSLAPGARLAEIYGPGELDVASWHHQAVGRPGQGLRPVAWAPDGVIEALELEGAPQVLAVQWHPELDLEEGSPHRTLFASFVASI
ncbi:MAG: gamma-glutamyl-gamma-aminobutyrate hydrolase family protein [Myxococcales bacterium]|nr:gamma-glutamyl-gamma-aminobutyrate hydrolase family protein [Myxococcales bacterium]